MRTPLAGLITPGLPIVWERSPAGAPFTAVGDELTSRRLEGSAAGTPE